MCGASVHATVGDVEVFWDAYLAERGLQPFEAGVVLPAYVSDGRWVADCVRCASGVACWPENPRGCCLACGAVYTVVFPPAADIARAERVLDARPAGAANWRPDLGEDVADLKVENLVRAVPLEPAFEL